MDKGILRFMAEAYLLLHSGAVLQAGEGVGTAPPRETTEEQQRASSNGRAMPTRSREEVVGKRSSQGGKDRGQR